MPFQIVNANGTFMYLIFFYNTGSKHVFNIHVTELYVPENGNLVIPGGQAGVGLRDCPYDFILINGYRLCGERFNDATTNVLFVEDAPVTGMRMQKRINKIIIGVSTIRPVH